MWAGPYLLSGVRVWLDTHCSRLISSGDGCSGPRRRLLPTAPREPDKLGVVIRAGPPDPAGPGVVACTTSRCQKAAI
jgi:hypothetical protein